MVASFYLFVGTLIVMAALGSLGIVAGYVHARVKERRFLRAFNADLATPVNNEFIPRRR